MNGEWIQRRKAGLGTKKVSLRRLLIKIDIEPYLVKSQYIYSSPMNPSSFLSSVVSQWA
jgi:hypothetical protein